MLNLVQIKEGELSMKKILIITALTLATVFANENIVSASIGNNTGYTDKLVSTSENRKETGNVYQRLPNYNGKDMIMIDLDSNSKRSGIDLYKMKNGNLINTGNKISQFNNHRAIFWKANYIKINGYDYWKIGNNLFVDSSNIFKLNAKRMQEVGQEIQDFGNFYKNTDHNKQNIDTIKVNNKNATNVPVMSLQNDGSFALIKNKTLSNYSVWQTDQVKKYNDNIYCRISTNEWINATSYVVKNNTQVI